MYRNVAYLSKEQTVRLYTWDKDGKRVWFDIPYKPYYYVETNAKRSDDKTSLYNTPLRKREFPNEYRRRDSIASQRADLNRSGQPSTAIRLFENISPVQQFLIDQYCQQNDTPEFTQFPIKAVFVDIETYSPDKFPEPSLASDTVNVITAYDSLTKKYHTWGLGPYKVKDDDVVYTNCGSERELLIKFVEYIRSDHCQAGIVNFLIYRISLIE